MIRLPIILIFFAIFAGCQSKRAGKQEDPHRETIERIIKTEKTILDLAPYHSKIADSMTESGSESKESLREIFAETTNYTRVGEQSPEALEDFLSQLWQPILGKRKFSECQFGTLGGTFSKSGQRFDMKTKFEGKILDDQNVTGVHANQTITWTRINKLWTITDWTQHSFEASEPQPPLFVDSTSKFISNMGYRDAVVHSSHEKRTREAIFQKRVMGSLNPGMPGFNDWESAWQFPSVSIVDYDNDGWDDIFLTDRWDYGRMLRNVEGTFLDVTKDAGLDVGKCNCAIFADFDNDGDADAFVGRVLQDSQFFINENGTYRLDTSMEKELKFVRFVTAGSVADFNGDGLLDLYLSTYVSPSGSAEKDWSEKMVREADQKRFAATTSQHPFVDRGGPANILFLNINGKLKRIETEDETISQWRNSYQSVWHDWDSDGDPDLFVCNDFAPDSFLRNDTKKGSDKPVFVDVTEELIGPDVMGYSMGASWGDYDNDGDMDLHVSEMYSKAGNRILKQFTAADKRSIESAKGNFLFRNDGGKFTEVASAKNIAKVGWAFGGQFADFNNDGWLDLYVPSGFYTAPENVRSNGDL